MAVIEVSHLTKDYGHGRGIYDVSLQVNKGEAFGYLGPNGAGKTTTIRQLMGFSNPSSGKATINGKNCVGKAGAIHQTVGYLPGEVALPDGQTGWEFIHMMQNLRQSTDIDRVQYLVDTFKVDPSGKTKRMSFGEKRKLALVVAFMSDPDILILDEPTSGLDPVMQETFIEFLQTEKKRGKTILLSSHMFGEVDSICDRAAIIKDGKIVSTVEMKEIHHNRQKVFVAEFASETDALRFVRMQEFQVGIADKRSVRVSIHDREINLLIRKLDQFSVMSFREIKTSLQDYFLSFYETSTGGV